MNTLDFIEATQIRINRDSNLVPQIVNAIQKSILRKTLAQGERLPSIRGLASELGVAKITVITAYENLIALGYLESKKGAGFYVAVNRSKRTDETPLPYRKKLDAGILRQLLTPNESALSVSEGKLPTDWMFDEELIQSAIRTIQGRGANYLKLNGTPAGFLPLREQIQRKLAELEIESSTAQIITTHGATQAIDICIRNLVAPGETIFVDDPCYFKLLSLLDMNSVNTIGITWQKDGPDISDMEMKLKKHTPKLFITNSTIHNPTSGNLSANKAHNIIKLAERYNFLIIETDVNAEFQDQPSIRLAALDQLQRVIYIGSFCKNIGIAFRVGFMACPNYLLQDILNTRLILATTTPALSERVIYQILINGKYRSEMKRFRSKVIETGIYANNKLSGLGFEIFHPPLGGKFIWIKHPDYTDSNIIAANAEEHGIIVAPGSIFRPGRESTPYFRLSTASLTSEKLITWLKTL